MQGTIPEFGYNSRKSRFRFCPRLELSTPINPLGPRLFTSRVCPVTWHARTEDRLGYTSTRYSTSALDASRHGRFTPVKRPDTHCTRGWVDLGVDMDGSGKSRLQRSSKPEPSNPPPVAIPAPPSYSRTKKLSFLYSVLQLPSRERGRGWVNHTLPKPAEGLLVSPRNLRHTFYFQIR
jgi:hypothetical protein